MRFVCALLEENAPTVSALDYGELGVAVGRCVQFREVFFLLALQNSPRDFVGQVAWSEALPERTSLSQRLPAGSKLLMELFQ